MTANMLDYLHWRGDLSFRSSPFNEVDALICASLSYAELGEVVPGGKGGITLRDAVVQVYNQPGGQEGSDGSAARLSHTISGDFDSSVEQLLRLAGASERFGMVRLSRFVEEVDSNLGRQFAALTFSLPKSRPEHVVAFRGTDDTVVGWKEDFGMLYREAIPAHSSALSYLQSLLTRQAGHFCVCGHSKGGNLAVYACAHLPPKLQRKIEKIYNFDGPGFNFPVVDPEPFERLRGMVVDVVPNEAAVGMMMDTIGARQVVASAARYALQHNPFTWQVLQTSFVPADLSDTARLVDLTVKGWLTEISLEERAAFMDAFNDLLDGVGEPTISPDPLQNVRVIRRLLRKYSKLDDETKALMSQVFKAFSDQARQHVREAIIAKLPEGVLPASMLPDSLRPEGAQPKDASGENGSRR